MATKKTGSAKIAAPSATAGAGTEPRWHVLDVKKGRTGAHLVAKITKPGTDATALCGATGPVLGMTGTIPAKRTPPCEACASASK